MTQGDNIVAVDFADRRDAYVQARERVADFLIRHALFESYANARAYGTPYPFAARQNILPGGAVAAAEHSHQNTALIFLLDGELPRGLNKNFRLRESNRVTWGNLKRLAPHIDFTGYKAAHCRLDEADVEPLLAKLCPLDYALMITRPATPRNAPDGPCMLTHMHVKVERLTDMAIKEMAKSLGYIEQRLFERGEDHVDMLEAKFYEYYGFSFNASGRKGAAAMAAQLLASHRVRFNVFVSSAEDGRLTVLDEGPLVTQYMLIKLDAAATARFAAAVKDFGGLQAFGMVAADRPSVMLYRVRFRRAEAAQPHLKGPRSDQGLQAPWLEIADEAILSSRADPRLVVPFAWAMHED